MGNKEVEIVKKKILCILFFLSSVFLGAQELITAEPEILTSIPVGEKDTEIQYQALYDAFYSPGSPYIDEKGRLVFIPSGGKNYKDHLLIYDHGKISSDYPKSSLKNLTVVNSAFISQNGIGLAGGRQYYFNDIDFQVYDYTKENASLNWIYREIVPYGVIFTDRDNNCFGIDIKENSNKFTIVENLNIQSWLNNQPGEFSIGSDENLYKNGILWSPIFPLGKSNYSMIYMGRIKSGHLIWTYGNGDAANKFIITSVDGKIEMEVSVPVPEKTGCFNYGIGPWGEFYYLWGPERDGNQELYKPKTGSLSKLIVYRSHLKYFGRLNDDNVRLRKGPSTSAENLGTYPVKTGFRILEKGTAEETIGGQKNVWYKVRLLDGTEGWFFGAFVHNLYDGPNGNPPPWPNVADW